MLRRKKKHPTHANLKAKVPKSRWPINKSNPVRRAREFARAYGSKARVEFVKALGCFQCGAAVAENAHLHGSKSGMGRKGPYTDIVPLCRTCHTRYDAYTLMPNEAQLRVTADLVEIAWHSRQATQGTCV